MICTSPQPLGFSTLKRASGFHQEVLSRILRRLVNYGAVRKAEGRYQRAGQ
jgi:DNA-binding HxlR family transcriptional regulator